MISEKFAITMLRSEDSISLLAHRETDRSYLVEVEDRQVLNHILNICSNKRIKYINNRY